MTQPHHRHRHPRYRKRYKVTNWPAYERSPVKRGDFTLWLSESAIQSWHEDSNNHLGRPQVYSDLAIETRALFTDTIQVAIAANGRILTLFVIIYKDLNDFYDPI